MIVTAVELVGGDPPDFGEHIWSVSNQCIA